MILMKLQQAAAVAVIVEVEAEKAEEAAGI
jgi:hypothetical protein